MTEDERRELLMGTREPSAASDSATLERSILMSIRRQRRQVRTVRWAAAIAWTVFASVFIAAGVAESALGKSLLTSSLIVALRPVLLIALFLTVSWYVRSVSLRFASVQQALAAIQDRLATLGHDTDRESVS